MGSSERQKDLTADERGMHADLKKGVGFQRGRTGCGGEKGLLRLTGRRKGDTKVVVSCLDPGRPGGSGKADFYADERRSGKLFDKMKKLLATANAFCDPLLNGGEPAILG
jgi:hypothetical protein